MKIILYLPLVTFTLFLFHFVSAQNGNPNNNCSKWEYYFQVGAGTSNEKMDESNWYVPGGAVSFQTGVLRKIGKSIGVYSGLNYDFYSIKSDPFNMVHIGPGYYHTPTGTVPYIIVDDEESMKKRHRGYISVPIMFEYFGSRKWAPYFKLGTTLSLSVYDRKKTVFVRSGLDSTTPSSTSTGSIGTDTELVLFGTLGGGLQYKMNGRTVLVGLNGNVGITKFYGYSGFFDLLLPNGLNLEIGIRQEIGGKKR